MQSQSLSLDGIHKAQFERWSDTGRNRTAIKTQLTTMQTGDKGAHFPAHAI